LRAQFRSSRLSSGVGQNVPELRLRNSQITASRWKLTNLRSDALTGGAGVPTLGYVGADAFWNARYRSDDTAHLLRPAAWFDRVLADALAFFGDMAGKTLVDVGCGDGRASLFFARRGARVVAVDSSSVAIENISRLCAKEGITNLEPVCASAFDVANYCSADLVFGSMVLHHLEPFAEFGSALRALMKESAKGFFYENNGRNPLLMLLRKQLVGRFGVPKRGDFEESPLTPEEIDTLRHHFRVRVAYPELLLMRLAGVYLFRGHLQRPLGRLDAMLFHIEPLRKYGYRQYVYLDRAKA
jgi:2-polyprenyl-3-methyl-5-hydroxy-6-metoxy-1,4-benzoquinol methylase